MAFNFPDAPAVGDEFVAGGATYIWSGTTWDLRTASVTGDFVERAGDTMTGTLEFSQRPASEHAILITHADSATAHSLKLSGSSSTHSGIIEFFDSAGARRGYLGYGDANHLNLVGEGGVVWSVNGLQMASGKGIRWGSDSAVTDKFDFSKGICLYGYGGTSEFGFTITSGTLNYVVENSGNLHKFWCGGDNVLTLTKDLVTIDNSNFHNKGGFTCDGESWHTGNINGNHCVLSQNCYALNFIQNSVTGTAINIGETLLALRDEVKALRAEVAALQAKVK